MEKTLPAVEITEEMVDAGVRKLSDYTPYLDSESETVREIFLAMYCAGRIESGQSLPEMPSKRR